MLDKIGHLLNLQWQYKQQLTEKGTSPAIQGNDDDNSNTGEVSKQLGIDKISVSTEQYQALMALAEIGFLSGFKDKLFEIDKDFYIPPDVKSQIEEFLELCDFPRIINYLKELSYEQ